MKLLSIIVPLYNSEKYLPKCLDSLLNQDIPAVDYEIILVNDGSPDGSLKLAEEYASRYPNIIVLSQTNKGTSGARNTGIRHATGEYLYFVDPDDYILKNSLKEPLARMDEESLDVLRFGYTEVDEQYQPTRSVKHPEQPDYSPEVMDGGHFMAERLGIACYVWTFFFRTDLIKGNDIFFYEGDYFDDTPWLPRVLLKAERVDSWDVKRHFYLIRSNSLVQSQSQKNIMRKLDGQQFMIKELTKQKQEVTGKPAEKWYDMMIAHCVITMLSLVGSRAYDKKNQYVIFLRSNNILPITSYRMSESNRIKALLINFSPTLYCRLLHRKNPSK